MLSAGKWSQRVKRDSQQNERETTEAPFHVLFFLFLFLFLHLYHANFWHSKRFPVVHAGSWTTMWIVSLPFRFPFLCLDSYISVQMMSLANFVDSWFSILIPRPPSRFPVFHAVSQSSMQIPSLLYKLPILHADSQIYVSMQMRLPFRFPVLLADSWSYMQIFGFLFPYHITLSLNFFCSLYFLSIVFLLSLYFWFIEIDYSSVFQTIEILNPACSAKDNFWVISNKPSLRK